MKQFPLFSVLTLGFIASVGCGSDSGDDLAGAQVKTTQVKESYHFILNGCDTGKHDFLADSAENAKKQLCNALQDAPLNRSCAESLRQEFFERKCSGYSWAPQNLSTEAVTSDVAEIQE